MKFVSSGESRPSVDLPSFRAEVRTAGVFAGQFLVYALLGAVCMTVSYASGNVSPLWLPSGYALALVLLGGASRLPVVGLATFALTKLSGLPWSVCLVMGAGNTLATFLACELLRRARAVRTGIRSVKDVAWLVVAGGFVAPLVASTAGTLSLWAHGLLEAIA